MREPRARDVQAVMRSARLRVQRVSRVHEHSVRRRFTFGAVPHIVSDATAAIAIPTTATIAIPSTVALSTSPTIATGNATGNATGAVHHSRRQQVASSK